MLTIRLPDTLEKRLVSVCKRTDRPKSYFVREALARYLEDVEDMIDAEVVLSAPHARYSSKELLEDLGLKSVKPAKDLH